MIQSKLRISSVTSNSDHVFVTTRSQAGYGFDVWKMTADLTDGEVIVSGLSGCCGQMDVQCCNVDSAAGLFVAENSRGRVVRYNFAGEEVTNWGKKDRSGKDGFSSCCNPMNVCFSGSGDVFTAEASTGRIKRFSPEGEFLAYVGDVELVPGCKNVSIAVSPNDDTVYMLDLTRNHIAVMQPKSEEEKAADQQNKDEKAAANDTESNDETDISSKAQTEVAVK
jgi:sugar lactone lactonase YvrE